MALDPRGENRSYSGYANKKTGAGSYSNKSGNGPAVMGGGGGDDKRQKKQGIQVALGNAYYDKNGAYVVLRSPATVAKAAQDARLSDVRIQRANLPSEVAKQYAQPASTRPAVSIVSTAKTSAAPSAKIANSPMPISAAENAQIDTAFAAKATPKIKTTMGTETTGYGVNNSILGATGTSMVANLNSTNPLKVSPTSTQSKSAVNGSVPSYSQGNGAMSAASKPRTVSPSITSLSTNFVSPSLGGIQSTAATTSALSSGVDGSAVRKRGNVDYSKSTSTDPNDGKNLSANNNTVAPVTNDRYNQAYYAKLKANGMSTADILDIQKQAPGGKAYGGSTIVSEDQSRRAKDTLSRVTGSDAVLGDGVTRKYTQSGLFGENIKGEFNYKDGTKITTLADDPVIRGKFNEKTGRIEGGFRVGSRQVTTFAGNGNYTGATAGTGASTTGESYAVNTMSGGEDGLGGNAKTTTLTAKQSATLTNVLDGTVNLDDIVDGATVTTVIKAIETVEAVDGLIATTTDPDILKSLYQRKLSLMRLSRTRTRFAGLLDDPDTKKSQMSIV